MKGWNEANGCLSNTNVDSRGAIRTIVQPEVYHTACGRQPTYDNVLYDTYPTQRIESA